MINQSSHYKWKWAALDALSGVSIRLTDNNNISAAFDKVVEIKSGSVLTAAVGFGDTPEEAIEELFSKCTNLSYNETLVLDAMNENKKEYKWNNFLWKEIK